MSYITKRDGSQYESKRLQIAEITLSGQPALNGYYDLSVTQNTYDSAPTVTNSNELNLATGNYQGLINLNVTRSTNSDNYQFQAELNGSVVGKSGQTAAYLNDVVDPAEFEITLSSAGIVKVKCVGVESSAPTLEANQSKLWLWRVVIS